VLVDLGYEGKPPKYWIVPAWKAQNVLIRSGTRVLVREKEVEEFHDAWNVLDP
jgi:hypothetical protein